MKKKTIKTLVAFLLITGNAMAQSEYPTVYANLGMDFASSPDVENVWDGIIKQTPGQGLGLVARGAKKIVSTIKSGDEYTSEEKWECELYPNGLIKSRTEGERQMNYMYNKQWRLLSIQDKDDKVLFKYSYDDKGRLVKTIKNDGGYEYTYIYNDAGQLTRINAKEGTEFYYTIKNGNIVQQTYNDHDTYPQTFSYDTKGRWTGTVQIVWGYEGLEHNEVIVKYGSTGVLPSGFTKRMSEYDADKKKPVGEAEVITGKCVCTYDSKGNWTTWKFSSNDSYSCNISRTITYYTDEEVKTAVAEMESARNIKEDQKKETEDLWEF